MALISFAGSPHGGDQKLLPEWKSQPVITPRTIIDHSIVGSALGAWLMFRDRSNLESHFIIAKSGFIWQLMDTGRQADANLNANDYALSIETEDNGDPDRDPWTRAQLNSLIWLHRKLRAVHSTIPNRKSRSCGDPGGHGFHTLHGAPSCWTPVAKSCPGGIRKRQWSDTLLPAYLSNTPLEDEMTDDQMDKVLAAIASQGERTAVRTVRWIDHGDPEKQGASNHLERVREDLASIKGMVGALGDDEAKVLAAISGLSGAQATAFATLATAVATVDAGMDPTEVQQAAIQIATELRNTGLPQDVVAALKEAL
jgi:hypothetical protein